MPAKYDYLCQCEDCSKTLVDNNPPGGAVMEEVPFNTEGTIYYNTGTEEYPMYLWVCPFCKSNEHLTSLVYEYQ